MGFFDFLFNKRKVTIIAEMSDGSEYTYELGFKHRNYTDDELIYRAKSKLEQKIGKCIKRVIESKVESF